MNGFKCYYCNLTTEGRESADWEKMVSASHSCFMNKGEVVMDDDFVLYIKTALGQIIGLGDVETNDDLNATSPMSCSSTEESGWCNEAVLLLIENYEKNKSVLEKKNSLKKHIWQQIAKEMEKYGFNMSWDRLQNKWKGLIRTYKSIKDSNKETGRDRKTWTYYNRMEEVLANDPAVDPPTTCHNGKVVTSTVTSESTPSTSGEKENDENIDPNIVEQPPQKKRKRQDHLTTLLEKAIEQQEVQHQEEMLEKRRFNDLFESFISSLNK